MNYGFDEKPSARGDIAGFIIGVVFGTIAGFLRVSPMSTIAKVVLTALLCSAATVPIAAKERDAPTWPAVIGANTIVPPGEKPPLVEADYLPYRTHGTGGLEVDVAAHFVDGSTLKCRDNDDVARYPATPYVLWALRTWIATVDGERTLAVSPDDVVPMPAYLSRFSSTTLLAFGHCHDGHVVFRNVPSGKYYLVGSVIRQGSGSGYYVGGYRQTTEIAPDGLHTETTPNGPFVYGPSYGDSYVMTANEPVEIKSGLTYYMTAASIHPAAHILQR
ncbi:MAG: hypothetical protein IAI48_15900 [Candidatus Eremiobacteraeota bacterium]|nr:hypothetical protein [Candidatus Eremiobacteraeota bacterium]